MQGIPGVITLMIGRSPDFLAASYAEIFHAIQKRWIRYGFTWHYLSIQASHTLSTLASISAPVYHFVRPSQAEDRYFKGIFLAVHECRVRSCMATNRMEWGLPLELQVTGRFRGGSLRERRGCGSWGNRGRCWQERVCSGPGCPMARRTHGGVCSPQPAPRADLKSSFGKSYPLRLGPAYRAARSGHARPRIPSGGILVKNRVGW